MLMIGKDLEPMSIVEDIGFQDYSRILDRKYRPPTRATLRDSLIPELFNRVREDLKAKLSECSYLSCTTDIWTSGHWSFLAVIGHYWDKLDGKLQTSFLDCARFWGNHTGEAIRDEFEQIFADYKIRSKVLMAVTDNASNVVKAIKLMEIRHLSCYAHCLNLVFTDTLKESLTLIALKQQVSRIITCSKQSQQAGEKLEVLQRTPGKSPKKLVQEVSTRWNSMYFTGCPMLIVRR